MEITRTPPDAPPGLHLRMMRALGWVARILLFVVVLGFALKNSHLVTLHFFLGYVWDAPLVVLLLAAFCLGSLLGMLALLPLIFRLRRERGRSRSQDSNPTPSALQG